MLCHNKIFLGKNPSSLIAFQFLFSFSGRESSYTRGEVPRITPKTRHHVNLHHPPSNKARSLVMDVGCRHEFIRGENKGRLGFCSNEVMKSLEKRKNS